MNGLSDDQVWLPSPSEGYEPLSMHVQQLLYQQCSDALKVMIMLERIRFTTVATEMLIEEQELLNTKEIWI